MKKRIKDLSGDELATICRGNKECKDCPIRRLCSASWALPFAQTEAVIRAVGDKSLRDLVEACVDVPDKEEFK